ncbi:MAG TPA: response regulator [Acidobacteriaceae bacterium]|nr:response regulator [Acidobacteriaceae bacterium]
MPKRRVLLVDDEVPVLLTMKAVLEISGFDVDTATSAHEGRSKIRAHEYQMVITDMRMESDAAGREVIQAARTASYHPCVALLTAYPVGDEEWQDMGADRMLVKPMQTPVLIRQLEKLLESHAANLAKISSAAAKREGGPVKVSQKAATGKKAAAATRQPAKKASAKKAGAKKVSAKKSAAKKGKRAAR